MRRVLRRRRYVSLSYFLFRCEIINHTLCLTEGTQ